MKTRSTLVLALALIAVGTVGLIALSLAGGTGSPTPGFASNGQRIYYTGENASGPIPRAGAGRGLMGFGMMSDLSCVDCHGEDGRGGRVGMMYGTVDVADIRYSTLTTPGSEDGTTVPAWTDADIARAIREGVEPNGERLKAPMPRWTMSDSDIRDVIAYLKELDSR